MAAPAAVGAAAVAPPLLFAGCEPAKHSLMLSTNLGHIDNDRFAFVLLQAGLRHGFVPFISGVNDIWNRCSTVEYPVVNVRSAYTPEQRLAQFQADVRSFVHPDSPAPFTHLRVHSNTLFDSPVFHYFGVTGFVKEKLNKSYIPLHLQSTEKPMADYVFHFDDMKMRELWGDWDLCNPSHELTAAHLRNIPKQSLLSHAHVCEAFGMLEAVYNLPVEGTHGPSAIQRVRMWNSDGNNDAQARRTRLARHLMNLPGVLVDMQRDPMCPWKGMRFFHGTDYAALQTANPGNAASKRNYEPCQLHWDKYTGSNGNEYEGSCFTSPYPSKGFSYGKHIFTYELTCDGKTLKMLDLRNDYVKKSHKHPELDPFRPIWELAGIVHGGKDRDEKARLLYLLFKDTGVDGAIMNNDVEWVWFRPGDVLKWVAANEWDGDEDERLSFETALITRFPDDASREKQASEKLIALTAFYSGITPARLCDFLATCTVQSQVMITELPLLRWKMDGEAKPYTNVFVPTSDPGEHMLWNAEQSQDRELPVFTVYECDYHALWRYMCPDLDNIWMADAITEGDSAVRKQALPYTHLLAAWKSLFEHEHNTRLLVHLPNGHTQLVPPLHHHVRDRRLHEVVRIVAPSTPDMVRDMPFRHPYKRPLPPPTTAKRAHAAAASDEQAKRAQPPAPLTGKMRKLCLC